jgi:hypothetical protein
MPEENETETPYESQTVAELKDELAERDLPKTGKKEDLVARLEESDQGSDSEEDQDGSQDSGGDES